MPPPKYRGPRDIVAFLAEPTEAQWNRELRDGWAGPDGSTGSTDSIFTVRIGRTSPHYRWHKLPANRHDWLYRLARRYRLPKSWRLRADIEYRRLCMERCRDGLQGWRRGVAVVRVWARYGALRAGAHISWTKRAQRRRTAWNGAKG
jgi:hypothetical protein